MTNTTDSPYASANELGKKCNNFFIKNKLSCKDNVSSFINKKKYDFICLQESAKWEDIYNNKLNIDMNYIYNKAGNGELVTFFNKNRFVPKYSKFGNLTNDGGRPYHVIFFEEINGECETCQQ